MHFRRDRAGDGAGGAIGRPQAGVGEQLDQVFANRQ
jgi:hypothetical protein